MNGPAPYPEPVASLLLASAYPHTVTAVTVAETHISWVLLTGEFAYKIKKPVSLPFLDFSSLEQRRQACEQELRLNRRFAPQLYLDVVPIGNRDGKTIVGATREPIEFAVKMHQFAAHNELDQLLAAGQLGGEELERFGYDLADLHEGAAVAKDNAPYGTVAHVQGPVHETLTDLGGCLADADSKAALQRIGHWCRLEEIRRQSVFSQRRQQGRIREGHGDLHLANLVRLDGRIIAFDCIEFSEGLRWGDVINDVAFLVMDLLLRKQVALAYCFLNAYLERSGDYDGLPLLRYYIVYRALVRAKVKAIHAGMLPTDAAAPYLDQVRSYLQLAGTLVQERQPLVILVHGLSGSGKSRSSLRLAQALPAIRIRSDVERKRLHGLAAPARSGSALGAGIYSPQSGDHTYQRLTQLAAVAADGGENVIVDACFLQAAQRQAMLAAARNAGLRCRILHCTAPDAVLRARIEARARHGADASEADGAVLSRQQASAEPLSADERELCVELDTTLEADWSRLCLQLNADPIPG